jgi:hypothetical protein
VRRYITQICLHCRDLTVAVSCEQRAAWCRTAIQDGLERLACAKDDPIALAEAIMRDAVELADYTTEGIASGCRSVNAALPASEAGQRLAAVLGSAGRDDDGQDDDDDD